MKLRDLLEAPERVHQFFAGQNLDHDVRFAVNPGVLDVVVEPPAAPEAPEPAPVETIEPAPEEQKEGE